MPDAPAIMQVEEAQLSAIASDFEIPAIRLRSEVGAIHVLDAGCRSVGVAEPG